MRSRRQSGWFGIAIGGALLAAWGCGGGPAPVKIAPVSGVVTYKGVPVRDAYVKLFQERCPIVAGGFTDDMGRFTLTSIQTGDGGPVGENKVTITVVPKPEAGNDLKAQEAAAEAIKDPAERRAKLKEVYGNMKSARLAAPKEKPRGAIPAKYAAIESTPLTCTVKAGQKNQCEFDLKD